MTADAPPDDRRPLGRRSMLVLAGLVAACLTVSALGGIATARSVGGWYQELAKPSFTPPDWLFAPVWLALYAIMAVAAWRVWLAAGWSGARGALVLFGVQLLLNLAWSWLFFGFQLVDLALAEMVVLWVAISATAAAFWRRDRIAGVLMLPYLAWVAYAVALNAGIAALN